MNEDINNISLDTPIRPEIIEDGWYAECKRCLHEIDPHNQICPFCHQAIDWTWLYEKGERK